MWFLQAHCGLLFTITHHNHVVHLGLKTGPKELRLNEKLVGRTGNDEKYLILVNKTSNLYLSDEPRLLSCSTTRQGMLSSGVYRMLVENWIGIGLTSSIVSSLLPSFLPIKRVGKWRPHGSELRKIYGYILGGRSCLNTNWAHLFQREDYNVVLTRVLPEWFWTIPKA